MTAEDNLQQACVNWFRYQYPKMTMFAIPNGGLRNKMTAVTLKKTGVLAGVADLFLMHAVFPYNGLFIEMKVGKNKQTESQKEFQIMAEQAGYLYEVCYDTESFMTTVTNYIIGT